jgi:hypothetical protein
MRVHPVYPLPVQDDKKMAGIQYRSGGNGSMGGVSVRLTAKTEKVYSGNDGMCVFHAASPLEWFP